MSVGAVSNKVSSFKSNKPQDSDKIKDKKQKRENAEKRLLDKYDKSNNKYTNLKIDKQRSNMEIPKQQINNFMSSKNDKDILTIENVSHSQNSYKHKK